MHSFWGRAAWRAIAGLLLTVASLSSQSSLAAEFRLGVFSVDVTPPLGDGPCLGFMPRVETIEHPLLLKGIVLRAGEETMVLAAIDYCGIANGSDLALREAFANAAATEPERVALQSLHQHTAPVLDADAAKILYGAESPRYREHVRFTEEIGRRGAEAIRQACRKLRPVSSVAAVRTKVERIASNRRVPLADRRIGVRASLTRDAAIRDADEGTIDPWLRTITFFDGDTHLAQLHYYATHPQTFYGQGRVTWDLPGMAREQFQRETGLFTIYFTGCGGNVTVGKYNDGSRLARQQLADRLLDAMRRAHEKTQRQPELTVDVARLPAAEIDWSTAPIQFTVRDDGPFASESLVDNLQPDRSFSTRLQAACFLAFRRRLEAGHQAAASRLRLGPIDLVHLPGEPFVEHQLFAQQIARKDAFVSVAGYGDCGVWYYGPDSIYQDNGGYEQTWSLTGPCQKSVEASLKRLVGR